ncbi:patatin-like phospholipase domain-containing protein 2 [Parambassis ranga]|uniref:Patatin-like phospholipase domain-containing protein 2 n=1 Tax=Parambassis ranga TaxID=210632 RepID=A0A6P7ILC4_9TELE|nr:patatin-like phospholipase domain-containing protein 2 [Parambassis ranga]
MAPGVSSCHYREVPQSISFSGSGFLATYQLGVAQCLLNHAPWILNTAPRVFGASAGSLVAAAVVCEINLITIRDEMVNFAKQMRAFTLGPFNPSINVFHWLECILIKHLPSDAHQRANGRLTVAMTRLTDGKHIVMSEYQSKEDVLQALLCSCFVPGYCGFLPPSFKGVHYLDGGFSGIQPVSSSTTLTVCPFSGETDICPTDTPCVWDMVVSGTTLKLNMANGIRIIDALYPIALENLEQAYHSGYKDAFYFLQLNALVPYLMIGKAPNKPCSHAQNNAWMNVENATEEEIKVEKENNIPLTSFTDNKSVPMSPTEQETTKNRVQEPLLYFDMLKNVLLGNAVAYRSMFGLPAKILAYLFLPLMLSFYAVLQSRHRLELLFTQAPELAFWTWLALKQITFFFFNICVCTLQKNIKDRVMPILLLLKWLKVQAQFEAPSGKRCINLSTSKGRKK